MAYLSTVNRLPAVRWLLGCASSVLIFRSTKSLVATQAFTLAEVLPRYRQPLWKECDARAAARNRQETGRKDLLASSVEAMPGVVPVLSELAKRYKLCVASSSAPCRIAASLNRAALTSFFGQNVFGPNQVARGKPFPDLFLHAAAVLGVARLSGSEVIEDSAAGIEAAKAAGMPCLGFHRWGYTRLQGSSKRCAAMAPTGYSIK